MRIIKKAYKRFKSWMDYDPPGSMTSKGWRLFKQEYKERAPVRYWFTNEFKYSCIMPIKWKYEAIHDWIRYRTYDRYHIVDTGLPPSYYDASSQMLHVNFNMLKEFVEVEQAWNTYCWSDRKDDKSLNRFWPFSFFFRYNFRQPALGIKHLEWAATLDDPNLPLHERCDHQAVASREILALYKWWVEDRPARKEIEHVLYDDQGFGMMSSLDDDFDRNAEDFKAHVASMDAALKQEEDWNNEDEEMLVRLMRIRKSLWT